MVVTHVISRPVKKYKSVTIHYRNKEAIVIEILKFDNKTDH